MAGAGGASEATVGSPDFVVRVASGTPGFAVNRLDDVERLDDPAMPTVSASETAVGSDETVRVRTDGREENR